MTATRPLTGVAPRSSPRSPTTVDWMSGPSNGSSTG